MNDSPSCCGSLLAGMAEPTLHRLANGSEVISLVLDEAPLICLDFWARAGSAYERHDESGLAHFLEHMIFKGSEHLEAGEFDRRIEALGGTSNAATGFDDVHYHVLIPTEAAAEALSLLLDLVLRPRLEPEAFTLERQVVLEELAQSEDQPEEVALQSLLSLACPQHPYGLPILGRREALLAHDPAAMADYHRRHYGADRCVLGLSGAPAAQQLLEALETSALASLGPAGPSPAPQPLSLRAGIQRIALPRLEAARLLMAWWQPPAADLDQVMGADLATSLLAEGRRSRLVARLREDLQLVESIDLDLHVMECGSLALLEAVCEADDLPRVRREVTDIWSAAIEQPWSQQEWRRVKTLVGNAYRFGLESAASTAALIGNSHLWRRPFALDAPLRAMEHWDPERLRREALASLDPARACVLEVVPA
ncbi:MAG: pitrilysin family protein [Synechococcaceae cyanobacterium]|nr:pitrilysin family protein [Synechococcaceae cyanobacterium]